MDYLDKKKKELRPEDSKLKQLAQTKSWWDKLTLINGETPIQKPSRLCWSGGDQTFAE